MLKRLFSSLSQNVLKCSDCRLYDAKTKLCKINKLNAIDNRMDDLICGGDGKKFWPLDKTNLIKSNQAELYGAYFGLFTLISIPTVIFVDYRLSMSSCISYYVADTFLCMSISYKKQFMDDNNIN